MKTAVIRCFVLAFIGLSVPLAVAADWPVFQQNYQRNAKTSDSFDLDQLTLLWQRQLAGPPNPAWSGPAKWDAYAGIRGLKSMRNYDPAYHVIAVGDRIWIGSSMDDAVHCLNLRDGQSRWQFTTDGPIRVAPSFADGQLYFGSDDGHAYCIEAESGELRWRFSPRPAERRIVNNGRLISMWPVRTGILVDGGIAYFGASLLPWQESYLCAVDATTGASDGAGHFVTPIEDATMEGPLSLVPGRFLVSPQGRIAPRLFSPVDGSPVGQLQGGGGSFVVLTKDSVFHGPGNKTGWLTASSLESLDTVASYRGGNAMVVAGDVSFILTDDSLSAANYVTREQIWLTECDCPLSMILAGETLFVGGQDRVRAFDARSGKTIWSHRIEGKAFALAAAGGVLLVSTDTGQLFAFAEVPGAKVIGAPPLAQGHDPEEHAEVADLQSVKAERDPTMKDRWVFQLPHVDGQRVRNLAGGPALVAPAPLRLNRINQHQALAVGRVHECLKVTDDLANAELPQEQLTATAWVRIDKPTRWGGIVGCLQDNGDYERGWLLGYQDSQFSFALCGQDDDHSRFTTLAAPTVFGMGQWHHVAGSYDGHMMRLYVDGIEVATSDVERGAIAYPPKGAYVVGGYEDENEHYLLDGMLHEVRVYRRALTGNEISQQYRASVDIFPEQSSPEVAEQKAVPLALGPLLQFDSPGTATVSYRTRGATESEVILYQQGQVVQRLRTLVGTEHQVRFTGLRHDLLYTYEIEFSLDGKTVRSPEYECDTFFDFSVAQFPSVDSLPTHNRDSEPSNQAAHLAAAIATRAGQSRGLCVCLGCRDGSLIEHLVNATQWRVIAFDSDGPRVDRLRRQLQQQGLYGVRATVHYCESLEHLPVTSRFANVVVSEAVELGESLPTSLAEVRRLLSPRGVALFGGTAAVLNALPAEVREAGRIDDQGNWLALSGSPIPGAGEWSHIYGTASNNHYGGEALSGAQTSEDLVVQWVGRPGARYQADRNGRKPPPLATAGRLFLQGLHRILALDQYNGTVLWSLEIPEMDRYNMPRDCGNWCADEDAVYLAVHGQCWKLSAADGALLEVIDVTRPVSATEAYDWGYVAREHDLLLGSAVQPGNLWSDFWGKEAWYDAPEGPVTDKVSSDVLFARDVVNGEIRWRYQLGAIVNSTITVGDGTVYFVESRSEDLKNSARRLGGDAFWKSQYLVALDAQTGRLCWERPLDTEDGTTAFYTSYGDGRLVLVSSAKRQYFLYAVQGKTGNDLWNTRIPWGKGKADHGSHLSRPAIVGQRLFVRPGVFNLQTGEKLPLEIPVGGCGTYACTDNALLFRAGSGKNSAMWTIEDGTYTMWDRLRPDCWLSTIPAGGMLLSPEGGGGCSCGSWLETSIGFLPREALRTDAPH